MASSSLYVVGRTDMRPLVAVTSHERKQRRAEAAAWREIGRRIERGTWKKEGLCYEITQLWLHGVAGIPMTGGIVERMQRRVSRARREVLTALYGEDWPYSMERKGAPRYVQGGYIYPEGKEPGARAMLAYTFAEEAEHGE